MTVHKWAKSETGNRNNSGMHVVEEAYKGNDQPGDTLDLKEPGLITHCLVWVNGL